MTAAIRGTPRAFRRALLFSGLLHAGLIVFIVASPDLSKSAPKGLIQYVNFIGSPGGGTGGGGESGAPQAQPLPPPKTKDSLRDLTLPAKAKADEKPGMRHPVDKPKTAKKAPEKQAAISKPVPAAPTAPAGAAGVNGGAAGAQSGAGFGLRFGTGGGGTGGGAGGGGTGSGGGDPFGVANFPFQFYLQMISDKITANWFQSLVDPGVGGMLQTEVYFRIYKNGQISDVRINASSGVESFDLSARRAIEAAKPFAPLPNEYDGQYLGITLVFEHAK